MLSILTNFINKVLTYMISRWQAREGCPALFFDWAELMEEVVEQANTELNDVFRSAPTSFDVLPKIGLIFTIQSWNDTDSAIYVPYRIKVSASMDLIRRNTPFIFAQRPVDWQD